MKALTPTVASHFFKTKKEEQRWLFPSIYYIALFTTAVAKAFATSTSSWLKQIGGKWKLPILCTLSCGQGIRYNELMKKVQGISNTMLAASLKELEKDGLVRRVQYQETPIRVEYFITEKSQKLAPVNFAYPATSARGFSYTVTE